MYEKHDMWYIVKCFAHWGKWRNASTSNTRSFWVTPVDTRQLQGRDYVRYVSRSQGEKWISHLPQNRSGAAANMPSGAEIFLNSCTFIRHVEKLDFTGWLVLKKARLQSWGTTCHSNTYSILIPFLFHSYSILIKVSALDLQPPMSALLHGTFAGTPWTSKRCWQQSTPNCCICAKNYPQKKTINVIIVYAYKMHRYFYMYIYIYITIELYMSMYKYDISRSSHWQTPSRVPPGVSRWGNDCPEADPWNEKIRWRGSPHLRSQPP